MATTANKQPIYPGIPFLQANRLTSQTAPRDGASGSYETIHTAGANGALIQSVTVVPLGDNVQTVLRLYITLSGTSTNLLVLEQTVATTASSVETAEQPEVSINLLPLLPANSNNRGILLPALATLRCSLGTAVAAGVHVITQGGDY